MSLGVYRYVSIRCFESSGYELIKIVHKWGVTVYVDLYLDQAFIKIVHILEIRINMKGEEGWRVW